MLLLIFLCIFCLLINYSLLCYNENFLLCILFIIFFILVYLFLNKKYKEYNFFSIFKTYFLILYTLVFNNYFNNLVVYYFLIKKVSLQKKKKKTSFFFNFFLLKFNNVFEFFLIFLCLFYMLYSNILFKLLNIIYMYRKPFLKLNYQDGLLFF